jgi:hypothetical protein
LKQFYKGLSENKDFKNFIFLFFLIITKNFQRPKLKKKTKIDRNAFFIFEFFIAPKVISKLVDFDKKHVYLE